MSEAYSRATSVELPIMLNTALHRRGESTRPGDFTSVIEVPIEYLDGSASGRFLVQITSEVIDAIAHRVLELQRKVDSADQRSEPELLTVAELAKRLRVNPKWVYAHQNRLGAVRLGNGPKARLRFPAAAATAGLQREHRRDDRADSSTLNDAGPVGVRRRRLASRPVPAIEPGREQHRIRGGAPK
jgi:hypothetical protein